MTCPSTTIQRLLLAARPSKPSVACRFERPEFDITLVYEQKDEYIAKENIDMQHNVQRQRATLASTQKRNICTYNKAIPR